jgi:hypothetical protein
MGLVLAVVAAVGGTALLWLLFRGRSNAGGTTTSLGPDGFFVRGSFDPGARVRYEVCVNGTWRKGVADITSNETFVYTGTTPTDVRILEVIGGEAPVSSSVPSVPSPPSSDDSFTGFPSAY